VIEPFALDIRSDESNDVAKDGFVLSGIEWDRLRVLDVDCAHSKLWEYWVECPKCVNGFDGLGNAVCECMKDSWPGHQIHKGHQKQLWRPDEASAECRRCKAKAGDPCNPKPFGKSEFHPERVHQAMAAAATANRKANAVSKSVAVDPQNAESVPCGICLAAAGVPCRSGVVIIPPHQARKVRLQMESKKQQGQPSTALDVKCTYCAAPPGVRCSNHMNRGPGPVKFVEPHGVRLHDASEERSDSDKKLEAILQGLGVTNVADATKRIQDIALNSTRQSVPPPQGQLPEPLQTQRDKQRERIRKLGQYGVE
jgi:hypothetical protein